MKSPITWPDLIAQTEGRTGGSVNTRDVDLITEYYKNDPAIVALIEAGANAVAIRCAAIDQYEKDLVPGGPNFKPN